MFSLNLCNDFSNPYLQRFSKSYNEKVGSSGCWSDKVCHLCLEFEAMSHGGTERTEDY